MSIFSAPDYAGTAITNERGRQNMIRQGMSNINSVFSGGTVPMFQLASGGYNPSQQYFTFSPQSRRSTNLFAPWGAPKHPGDVHDGGRTGLEVGAGIGTVLAPGAGTIAGALLGGSIGATASGDVGGMLTGGVSSFFGDAPKTRAQRYPNMLNKGDLFVKAPDQTYAGFNDDFFNRAGQAYINYATPQLAQQYKSTKDSMLYGLANRGLSQSGAKNKAMSDLSLITGRQQQNIADTARETSQDLRSQIEAARSAAINQLYQTGDPSTALQSATSAAAGFQVPQAFNPIANAFSGLANQYASNMLYNPAGTGGQSYVNPWNSYFGQGGGSGNQQILGPTVSY